MNLRVIFSVDAALVNDLVAEAIRQGYTCRTMVEWEKRAAIRWLAVKLLTKAVVEQR